MVNILWILADVLRAKDDHAVYTVLELRSYRPLNLQSPTLLWSSPRIATPVQLLPLNPLSPCPLLLQLPTLPFPCSRCCLQGSLSRPIPTLLSSTAWEGGAASSAVWSDMGSERTLAPSGHEQILWEPKCLLQLDLGTRPVYPLLHAIWVSDGRSS